ncbi:MAG: signal peptidase II [Sedimentisphaerales bacterium]|nr:signal peptidase II [Sedimentisphaerales bacterium]
MTKFDPAWPKSSRRASALRGRSPRQDDESMTNSECRIKSGVEGTKSGAAGEVLGLRSVKAHLRLWLMVVLGFGADLASKIWVIQALGEPQDEKKIVIIEGYVNLICAYNTGAVAGFASGKTALLLTVSVMALVFLFWIFAVSRASQWVQQICIGMLFAGALGNMYDRIFNDGRVIDFINVDLHFWPANPWPTFNVADVLLCVGVGILLLSQLGLSKSKSKDHKV